MSLFPKVQSPCPYKGRFVDIMQGSRCRLCKREVIDLTHMGEQGRKDFLATCEAEVCISYRVGAKSALAAAAMGVFAIPNAAAAQDAEESASEAEAIEDYFAGGVIIVGGMKKPHEAEWVAEVDQVDVSQEASELPVEYDDPAPAGDKDAPADSEADGKAPRR